MKITKTIGSFFKNLKKLIIALILFVISTIALIPGFIWGFIETSIQLFYKKKFVKAIGVFGDWILMIPLMVDVFLNIMLQVPFNRLFKTENGYRFGSRKDTISDVLGVNERDGTLSSKGKMLVAFLDFIDKNHAQKSIDE